jgi:hypothetical protein
MSNKPKPQKISKKSNNEGEKDNLSDFPGWPGYRTRDGRSGYDPVDSGTESGHVFGVYIQRFFTCQIKTKNPIHLFLLAIFGLLLVLPFAFAIIENFSGNPMTLDGWIFITVTGVIGVVAITNFIKNLVVIRR